ncbi:endonuclease domain-containing protein [Plantibacter sp. YIM 135249]|uniref:endonuclease domain-containing protein n=1 Tax=Plantibacter sp. YIM 135249 TaxID=3423918 RepID=UPI003D346E6F
MKIIDWLEQRRGIAHRADAIEAGFTRTGIERAAEGARLQVLRRHWLVAPQHDADLLMAASLGGALTCISAARTLGLWNIPDGLLHVSARPNATVKARSGVRLHWGSGPAPRSSRELVEPVENVLMHLAKCQPFERALVIFESAIRRDLVSQEHLARLRGGQAELTTVVRASGRTSDSGIETIPWARLARLGILVRRQVMIDGHPVDGLIGDRLIVQADGHEPHTTRAQRDRDVRQDRRLVLLGYTVLRFTYTQIMYHWPDVERTVVAAIAQGLHLAA